MNKNLLFYILGIYLECIYKKEKIMIGRYVATILNITLVLILISIGNSSALADGHNNQRFDANKPTVFITGSNRGIGLALVKNYAARGWNVIATCRSPSKAENLMSLRKQYSRVFIEEMDVTDTTEIQYLANKYKNYPIDILINNAGILGNVENQSFGNLNPDLFEKVMAVNALGPLKVAEAFADNVALSKQKKIVSMTSGLGSMQITLNSDRFYYYRMSKAALNMGVIAMNVSLKSRGVISALIAPGMVETQLLNDSGYRGSGTITTDESAAGLVRIIDQISNETIKKNRGKSVNYDGMVIPW
jgi:NAD(P)-dependent dehydrogenase (short-subunit alcohol dehydrogenase family)